MQSKQVSPGDLIQWEVQGVLQFVEPKKVTGLSDDKTYVFVEGSRTGLPIEQVSVVK